MSKFRIWATDCDGPGDIRWAPLCDTEAEAQEWIDNFTQDMDGSDITDIWIEEENEEETNRHEVHGQYEGETN